jgi:hypothetical protein
MPTLEPFPREDKEEDQSGIKWRASGAVIFIKCLALNENKYLFAGSTNRQTSVPDLAPADDDERRKKKENIQAPEAPDNHCSSLIKCDGSALETR